MAVLLQLILVVFLVLLNGFFVAAEFALVAIRKTHVDELVKKGNSTASLVQKALDHLDNFISATQLGITLASLALGWIGEPALAALLEPLFHFLPQSGAIITSHAIAFTLAFSLITFMHIVIGELVPKSIALQKPEKTSWFIIFPLTSFTKAFQPFISLLNFSGSIVLKLIGFDMNGHRQSTHSEEEVKMILSQSAKRGVLEKHEVDMIYKVLQFTDVPIQQIMIPRPDIVAFNCNIKIKDVIEKFKKYNNSRFPVYERSIDNIIGFFHIKDAYKLMSTPAANKSLCDSNIIRKIIFVPENKPADEVLYGMRKKRIHIVVVSDEYGGTAGIATLEDIVESIIGEIEDEFELPAKDLQKQNDGSYVVNGLMSMEKLRQKINLPLRGQGYTTIGGLVFGLLGRAPTKGDTVSIGDIELQVTEIEGKRIKTLKLKKTPLSNSK